MAFTMVITLLGGLAIFLYGMSVMSQGLEKMAGSKLESILRSMTSNKVKALLLGLGVTAVIQSSSAVTVMLVGLVNSGIMQLTQTVGVIMGTNIGTTVTAWILSLIGIESENFFVNLLKPATFSPIIALIGVLLIMVAKSNRKKDIGTVMIGFALLMYGMEFMSDAMEPLKDMPEFTSIMTAFNNPLFGLAMGLIVTAIIQSSSASVGILQALSLTSGLSYMMVIPIIMGQNIGTCVTSVISAIGVNKNAKRVAVVHITFNIIGTAIFMTVYCILNYFVGLAIFNRTAGPVDIAVIHSLFNIATTIILLPFNNQLVAISKKFVKDEPEKEESKTFLDSRLLLTPSVAVQEAMKKMREMVVIAFQAYRNAIILSDGYSDNLYAKIREDEQRLDRYEDLLGSFNVELSKSELSDRDSAHVSMMLQTITNAERIGDHALNIAESVTELHEKHLEFQGKAKAELRTLTNAMEEIVTLTKSAVIYDNLDDAVKVEPLEEVIDDLVQTIRVNHIARLKQGESTIEMGFILQDVLGDIERVSDHCSNIAVSALELERNNLFMHAYTHSLKAKEDPVFKQNYEEYSGKYSI